MRPRQTWVWDRAAYTWPVVDVWRDARSLDADLDAALSFDPARLVRARQLDASVHVNNDSPSFNDGFYDTPTRIMKSRSGDRRMDFPYTMTNMMLKIYASIRPKGVEQCKCEVTNMARCDH